MSTLALDFDGVLRKWPRPMEIFADFLAPNDLLVRARLFTLRHWLCKVVFDGVPIVLDPKMVNAANTWDGKVIIITGRTFGNVGKAMRSLRGKLNIRIYFRANPNEPEEVFKYRTLKKTGADMFIEDRAYVVQYLRKKGINVYHIREVRK